MRAGGTTCTGRSNCPARRPLTSTDASKSPAVTLRDSRGPRTCTVTAWVINCTGRVALRTCTTTPSTLHSMGAAAMLTVTRAACGTFSRTEGSGDPTVTVSVTGPAAPATLTGSVIASVSACSAPAGPTTSTAAGSAVTVPTTKPGAG